MPKILPSRPTKTPTSTTPRHRQELSTSANPAAPTARPVSLKRILVPVDFSECSRKGLQYALAFARQFQAEVSLLHVVPDVIAEPRFSVPAPDLQHALLEEGRRELDEEIQAHAPQASGLKPLVRKGVPFQEIVQAAEELGADLIVVGTHGRTGLKHVLLGSTAERVVRHASCPVLVVREHEHECLESRAG